MDKPSLKKKAGTYVLMITQNIFPNGNAGAVRDLCFAKIYQALGYQVAHIGMGQTQSCGMYEDVEFYSLHTDNRFWGSKPLRHIYYKKRLKKLYQKLREKYGTPYAIHTYSVPNDSMLWAKKTAIQNNIPIINDTVEWYSPCQFKFGCFNYHYIAKDRCNKKILDKPFRIIAISRYLENYFQNQGLQTARIPVILDSPQYSTNSERRAARVRFTYAGTPHNKDYIHCAIIAFCKLPEQIRKYFEFEVIGIDTETISKFYSPLPPQIHVHGKLERNNVLQILYQSDFGVLLRPEAERYAQAGFPTKVVEAMMCGCAMLCNITSDLGLYLADKENAVLVNGNSVEDAYNGFMQISEMTMAQIESLKKRARDTAVAHFDYRLYIDAIRQLLSPEKMR
jgi:Glycosyltransferase